MKNLVWFLLFCKNIFFIDYSWTKMTKENGLLKNHLTIDVDRNLIWCEKIIEWCEGSSFIFDWIPFDVCWKMFFVYLNIFSFPFTFDWSTTNYWWRLDIIDEIVAITNIFSCYHVKYWKKQKSSFISIRIFFVETTSTMNSKRTGTIFNDNTKKTHEVNVETESINDDQCKEFCFSFLLNDDRYITRKRKDIQIWHIEDIQTNISVILDLNWIRTRRKKKILLSVSSCSSMVYFLSMIQKDSQTHRIIIS